MKKERMWKENLKMRVKIIFTCFYFPSKTRNQTKRRGKLWFSILFRFLLGSKQSLKCLLISFHYITHWLKFTCYKSFRMLSEVVLLFWYSYSLLVNRHPDWMWSRSTSSGIYIRDIQLPTCALRCMDSSVWSKGLPFCKTSSLAITWKFLLDQCLWPRWVSLVFWFSILG